MQGYFFKKILIFKKRFDMLKNILKRNKMHEIHSLIVDLTLISVYAAIITLIFKRLKQPTVLGYILAGIFAGPFLAFLPTVTEKENLAIWADIGVIFLLFGLGLEFSFKKMVNVGKAAVITATSNIFFLLFLGYNTGLLLGWPTSDSFFLGSMISMSSTTIIIKAFEDLNIKKQPFTNLVFGVLIVEDLAGILLLVLLPTVALSNAINGSALILSALKLLFFLVLCFVTGIYLIPTFFKKIQSYLNGEILLLVTVALCFTMVWLATYFGFSSALGAFIMGSILAETPFVEKIEKIVKPLKDFFGAVFFVSVGMMVDPTMFIQYAYPILVITLIVICGQIFFSCMGFLVSGQNLKTAIQSGFSLAQVGEFAFIIATLGMSLKVIDNRVYPIIIAVSVITTFLTPMMIRSALPVYHFISKILPEKWLLFLEQNAQNDNSSQQEERLWNILFENYFIRLILFVMINYALIGVGKYLIRPFIHLMLPNVAARVTVTLLTLVLMAPFLKALLGWESLLPEIIRDKFPKMFVFKESLLSKWSRPQLVKKVKDTITEKKNLLNKLGFHNRIEKIYYRLWMEKTSNRPILVLLTSFRLITVCFFIMTVVHQFLTENPKVIFVLVVLSVIILSRSKWLFIQYSKMENQFFNNLNGRDEV